MKVDQMIIKIMMILMTMMMTMIMVTMMIMMMIILSPYGIPMHQRAASKVGVHLYFIQEKLYIDSISTTASYDCTALENISIVFFSEIAGCSKGNSKLLSEPLYIDAINFSFLQSCINVLSHSIKLIQYHIFFYSAFQRI